MQPERYFTHTLRAAPWGQAVASTLAAALEAVDPYRAVSRALSREGSELIAGEKRFNLDAYRNIFLVGAGKAGLPMAHAVVDVLGTRLTGGLVIVKDGYGGVGQVGPVRIREAGHPIPDERGVQATQEMLDLLAQAGENDLALVVVSGGGSALLTAPRAGMTLPGMQSLTGNLLACGAAIQEINTLRMQLDVVKGGGLARAAAPAQVVTFILSDVIGYPLDLIASGPTALGKGSVKEALEVAARYGIENQLPAGVYHELRQRAAAEKTHSRSTDAASVENILVGNNEIAGRAALAQAERLGFNTRLLTTTLQGEARQVGEQMAAVLARLASAGDPLLRPALMVAGGETTVTLRGKGLGGRNQELALAAVAGLSGLENIALISLATDGGDGPTNAAGAVVTGETLARAQALGLDVQLYLDNNDSYHFFLALDDNLRPGPTQTNVNDLLFLFAF